jgi:hypothetical protein
MTAAIVEGIVKAKVENVNVCLLLFWGEARKSSAACRRFRSGCREVTKQRFTCGFLQERSSLYT